MAENTGIGTGITSEQVGTILTIVQHAIPIKAISFEDAQAILGKNRDAFVAEIRKAYSKKRIPNRIAAAPSQRPEKFVATSIPPVGIEFELTLDGDAMPPERCCEGMSGWEYNGPDIIGKYTRRFKLVRIGFCKDAKAVREQLLLQGGVPNSQWMIAFKARFTQHDNNGPIGICDPMWELDKVPGAYFPSFFSGIVGIHFSRSDLSKDVHWRWLIEVSGGKSHEEKP